MKFCLFFLLFFQCSYSLISQVSKDDQEKIIKIIGSDFIQLSTQKNYPFSYIDDRYKIDMSTISTNDTVGVSFNNEQLLWHDFISFSNKNEILKMAKTSFITVEEYLEFQNYVRDSIARDLIYLNQSGRTSNYDNLEWTDDDSKEWINYKDVYMDPNTKELTQFDPSDRALGRMLFNLNWDKTLNYQDAEIIPILSDMYLTAQDRIYKLKELDERKLYYNYHFTIYKKMMFNTDTSTYKFPFNEATNGRGNSKEFQNNEQITALISDPFSWANSSNYDRDEFSVLSQTYNKLLLNSPMIGINGPQLKAYCNWKQKNLQKEFDKNKLSYQISLSLPLIEDLKIVNESTFTIPEKDYTTQWRITNEEYALFTKHVKDSILREYLYVYFEHISETSKLINDSPVYFDESTYEYTQLDPDDRTLSRYLFNLNYETNLEKFNKYAQSEIDSFKKTQQYLDPSFLFYSIRSKEKSMIGKITVKNYKFEEGRVECCKNNLVLKTELILVNGISTGKDLDISWWNRYCQSTSIRSYISLSRFISSNSVKITPISNIDNSNPEALMQGISYEQAIAFYYWKCPIYNPNPKEDWQNFVLPSKEQFEEIQKGKQVVVPEKVVPFPTPISRYVVHIYAK